MALGAEPRITLSLFFGLKEQPHSLMFSTAPYQRQTISAILHGEHGNELSLGSLDWALDWFLLHAEAFPLCEI